MANTKFDNSLITAIAVIDGTPSDVTEGLNFDGDFFKMAKANKDESNVRKGLKDSSYTAISTSDSERNIELEWIPGSPAIAILDLAMKLKKSINLVVNCESDPKFKFNGEECTISEEPEVVINGKTGFKNTMYKFKCPKSQYVYL